MTLVGAAWSGTCSVVPFVSGWCSCCLTPLTAFLLSDLWARTGGVLLLRLPLTPTRASFSTGTWGRLAASFMPPAPLRRAPVSLPPAFRLILTSLRRGWFMGAARSRQGLLILTPANNDNNNLLFLPFSWLFVLLSRSLSFSLPLLPSLSPHCYRHDALPPLSGGAGLRQPSVQSGFSSLIHACNMSQYEHVFPPHNKYQGTGTKRGIL